MRILIAEDDLPSRLFLFEFLSQFGTCDLTVDGIEAMDAFLMSLDDGRPYDLICLDVMMPKIDGIKALRAIRGVENERGLTDMGHRAKVIMTTALSLSRDIFTTGCEAYAPKPIDTEHLVKLIRDFGLLA